MEPDELYGLLHSSRENLCRAQMHVPDHWRPDLDLAVHAIDMVGSSCCPDQWSSHDQPEYGGS